MEDSFTISVKLMAGYWKASGESAYFVHHNIKPMPSFNIARITHNQNGWKKPSGPEHKSGDCSNESPAFEALYDFGFEEWLFDERHCLDNCQYGYVENIEANHQGSPLILYTLRYKADRSGPATRLLVGFINNWEHIPNRLPAVLKTVLPAWQQQMKYDLSNTNGISDSKKSLAQISLHSSPTYHKTLFNIRFQMNQLKYCFDKRISAANLTQNNHFTVGSKTWNEIPKSIQNCYSSF